MLKNVDEIVEAFSKENYVSGNLLISRGGKEEFSRSSSSMSKGLSILKIILANMLKNSTFFTRRLTFTIY